MESEKSPGFIRRKPEGKRPIFDRDEIKNHAVQHDEELGPSFRLGRLIDERNRDSPHPRDPKTRETDRGRDTDRSRDRRNRSASRTSHRARSLDRSRDDRERLRSPDRRVHRARTPDRRSPNRREVNRNPGGDREHFYEDGHPPFLPHPMRGAHVVRVRGVVPVMPHFVPVPMMRPGMPRPMRHGFPPRPMPPRMRPPVFRPPGPGFYP